MACRITAYILVALGCAAWCAAGIDADSGDFAVSVDYSSSEQSNPAIAVGPHGTFGVVWVDYRSGQGDIYCQMFDSGGAGVGGNSAINDDGTGAMQLDPDLACDWNGTYWAAWTDYRNAQYPFSPDIYCQRFDTAGSIDANIFVSDESPDSSRQSPAIDVAGWGRAVLAWNDLRNRNWDIYSRAIDSSGVILTAGERVNDDVGVAPQHEPAVAVSSDGWYVIVWYDNRTGDDNIYLQKFDSSNAPLGANIKVNTDVGTTRQKFPDVAVAGNGTIYVVWTDWRNGSYPDNSDIYFQRFDETLGRLGNNLMINSASVGSRRDPRVAADAAGNACIVWSDSSGGDWNARGQMIDNSGRLSGANFAVNLDKADRQLRPDVALDGYHAYFAWADHRNGNFDIYGRVWQYNIPGLTATPSRIDLERDKSEAGWDTISVAIGNAGFGELDFSILPEDDWLTLSQSTGSTPDTIMVYVHSGALDYGLHQGEIRLIDMQHQDSTARIIVTVTITGPVIDIDADTLYFSAVIQAGSPPDQQIQIDNSGTGELNWHLSTATTWITLSAISGLAGESIDIGCDIAGLTTGEYDGFVVVSDPIALNSPETLFVHCDLRSDLPYLKATPAGVNVSLYAAESRTDSVLVTNGGSGTIDWIASGASAWLDLVSSSGVDNDHIVYSISGNSLDIGSYVDTITISDTGAFNNPLHVPVALTILAGDTVGAMPVMAERGGVFHQSYYIKAHNAIDSARLEFEYDPVMLSVDSFVVSPAADSVMSVVFQNDQGSGQFSLRIPGNANKSVLPPSEYYIGEIWGTANDTLTGTTAVTMIAENSALSVTDYGDHCPVWVGGDIEISLPTAADDSHDNEPVPEYSLDQNRPNPFNGVTTISYSTRRFGSVSLIVYNILGQLVRTLVDGNQSAGPHTVIWDGRDSSGRDMASGIFFYKLQTADFSAVRKMAYLK